MVPDKNFKIWNMWVSPKQKECYRYQEESKQHFESNILGTPFKQADKMHKREQLCFKRKRRKTATTALLNWIFRGCIFQQTRIFMTISDVIWIYFTDHKIEFTSEMYEHTTKKMQDVNHAKEKKYRRFLIDFKASAIRKFQFWIKPNQRKASYQLRLKIGK